MLLAGESVEDNFFVPARAHHIAFRADSASLHDVGKLILQEHLLRRRRARRRRWTVGRRLRPQMLHLECWNARYHDAR